MWASPPSQSDIYRRSDKLRGRNELRGLYTFLKRLGGEVPNRNPGSSSTLQVLEGEKGNASDSCREKGGTYEARMGGPPPMIDFKLSFRQMED